MDDLYHPPLPVHLEKQITLRPNVPPPVSTKDVVRFSDFVETREGSVPQDVRGNVDDDPPEITKEIRVTHINIDSADRDTRLWPNPNNFDISLDKTYKDVHKVELSSIIFPNTNAVINSYNNIITWRNYEDVLNNRLITDTSGNIAYPVYSTKIRVGSYSANALAKEMSTQMNLVRRDAGNGDFHHFETSLNRATDVTTIVSLTVVPLGNAAFSTTLNSNIVLVTAPDHGLVSGSKVYLMNVAEVSRIPTTALNGFQTITVLDRNLFTFTVNVNASETEVGGGNAAAFGVQALFQLLFGLPGTVAPRLGFPIEHSSDIISNTLTSQTRVYLTFLTFFSPSTVPWISGQTVNLGFYENSVFVTRSSYILAGFVGDVAVLITGSTGITLTTSSTTYLSIHPDHTALAVYSTDNPSHIYYLLTTAVPHRYTELQKTVNVFAPETTPPATRPYAVIVPQLSPTSLIVQLTQVQSLDTDDYYNIQYNDPLYSEPLRVLSFEERNELVLLQVDRSHGLLLGDTVLTSSEPPQVLTVAGVFSDTHFYVVNSELYTEHTFRGVYLKTCVYQMALPGHKFNEVSNITKNIATNMITVQFILGHGLVNGDKVCLTNTNTTPSLDGLHAISGVTLDSVSFSVPNALLYNIPLLTTGYTGADTELSISEVSNALQFNGKRVFLRSVSSPNFITVSIPGTYSPSTAWFGGPNVFVTSPYNGFRGTHTNTRLGSVYKSINLDGDNYVYLLCPVLAGLKNTSNIQDVFAHIVLDQDTGYVCFRFSSIPKIFEDPQRNEIQTLHFSVVNREYIPYEFSNLNFSFILRIEEIITTTTQHERDTF